jgi:hypothetical protein
MVIVLLVTPAMLDVLLVLVVEPVLVGVEDVGVPLGPVER